MNVLLAFSLAAWAGTCPDGKVPVGDPDGHCCWPGQGWNWTTCAGTPTACPDGWHVEADAHGCQPGACPDGQHQDAAGPWCCFEGQRWSVDEQRCSGTPRCPDGWAEVDGTCEPKSKGSLIGFRHEFLPERQGTCPEGQHASPDGAHCCAPGQGWSSALERCVRGGFAGWSAAAAQVRGPAALPEGTLVLGPLEKDDVAAVLARNGNRFRYCLQRAEALADGAKLAIAVGASGASAITVQGVESVDPTLTRCLDVIATDLRFPEAAVGSKVVVPVDSLAP